MTTLVRLFARPALSAIFVSGGLMAVRKPQVLAPTAEPVVAKVSPLLQKVLPAQIASALPTDTVGLVRLNGAVHLVGGAMLSIGKAPRLAASALALSLVPTTLAGHPFWSEHDPARRQDAQLHFLKNLALLGGLLIASVDTEGQPGLPWRARRTAKDFRRSSRTAKRETRLSVRAARAQARRAGAEGRRRVESAGHAATAKLPG